jgi:hypothetical protein
MRGGLAAFAFAAAGLMAVNPERQYSLFSESDRILLW